MTIRESENVSNVFWQKDLGATNNFNENVSHRIRVNDFLKEGIHTQNDDTAANFVTIQHQTEQLSKNHHPSKCADFDVIKLMEYYDRIALTKEEKNACLNYLLNFQHYNSDYTIDENSKLGYSNPVIAPQKFPGYFRTEYMRILELSKRSLDIHIVPFFKKNFENCTNPTKCLKISSSYAVPILQQSYFKEVMITDLEGYLHCESSKKKCVFISLDTEDMKYSIQDLLTDKLSKIDGAPSLGKLRTSNPELNFLFELKVPGIDCTILWLAKWAAPSKRNTLRCVSLDNKDLFGRDVFSILNKLGAVPDRVALSSFLTSEIAGYSFSDAMECLGLPLPQQLFYSPKSDNKIYEVLEQIAQLEFSEDIGASRYRDAILRWVDCFFIKFDCLAFAARLMFSQVFPWTGENASLVEWAKAYQNTCEIVLFCLQSFPNKFSAINFQGTQQRLLDSDGEFSSLYQQHGLYAYAMTALFDIFDQIQKRPEFTDSKIRVSCVGQSYFETLCFLDRMGDQGHFVVEEKVSLSNLEVLPNVLVVDFHPNNASKETLFQNDVAHWVKHQLLETPERKLILILDVTMNHLSDQVLKDSLRKLKPYIEKGQLEIFGIQSLAKLVQLGADNFSGGACFYMGKKQDNNAPIVFPDELASKSAFFGILCEHFQDLISEYFDSVRKNTTWMYHTLRDCFRDIHEHTWVDLSEEQHKKSFQEFCAAKVVMNTDENTVYVSISFAPLMKALKLQNTSKQEQLANDLRKLLLTTATKRGLPVTGRQSFGFSLSNMSPVCDSIRFSIGVESPAVLQCYADLLHEFIYALSNYFGKDPLGFSFQDFEKGFLYANAVLLGLEKMEPFRTSLVDGDLLDCDFVDPKIGEVDIDYNGHELLLSIHSNNQKEGSENIKTVSQENIRLGLDLAELKDSWTSVNLMKLFVKLLLLDRKSVYVKTSYDKQDYVIQKALESCYMFIDEKKVVDERSNVTVHFEPKFEVVTNNGTTFEGDQVYVKLVEELGTKPVRVDMLDEAQLDLIYEKCKNATVTVKPYHKVQDAVRLKFA